jgi:multidrug efflux pump subunit AcrA (membrane-fusion protein)
MKRHTACAYGIAVILLGISVNTANGAEGTGPPTCTLALTVQLTPDVPNPSNGGFLSSLLGNNVGYRLTLIQVDDDTTIEVQLDGPGTVERCQEVVDHMREDGRVLSIDVQDGS